MDTIPYTRKNSLVISIVAATALITSTTCIFNVWRSLYRNKTIHDGFQKIPKPKGAIPYFGHLFAFPKDENPAATILKWQEETGPIMRIYMGVQPIIFISDAQLAHELLNMHGIKTANRPGHKYWRLYQSRGQGIGFNNPNVCWRRIRQVVSKFVSQDYVLNNLEIPMCREVNEALSIMINTTASDDQVDVFKPLQLITLNMALMITFASHAASVRDPLFTTLVNYVDRGVDYVSPLGDISMQLPHLARIIDLVTQKEKAMADFSFKERDPYYYHLVQKALASEQDCIAKAMDDIKDGIHITDETVMIACHDMIVGTTDPTAASVTWALALLCANPQAQYRLQEEIDAYLHSRNGQMPTFAEYTELPLVMSAIKECLRVRSLAPFILPHEASEDVEFSGYVIPKGTIIFGNLDSMHENPGLYDNPQEFIVDRFLDKPTLSCKLSKASPKDRDHYAFGWGRRLCPGSYLGECMMFNVLARLLAKASIEPAMSKEGKPLYPNIHERQHGDAIILPKQSSLRIVPRATAIVE
ncbi:cytochrome P450 [Lichtheimia hyalospora FSU 10163]|nr:cytochrome P450 [Lichtheimia hyalospora FSU 10163]